MKRRVWKLCLMSGVFCWMLFGVPRAIVAADQTTAGPDERLQRLEQRIDDLAQRQEQLMRRFGGPQEGPGPMGQPGQIGRPGPMAQSGPENARFGMPPIAPPGQLAAHALHRVGDLLRLIILAWIVCNILVTVWIYTDIRKRGEGSGILIALALVAGIPAAIIYSLVRIADKVSAPAKQA